MVKMPIRYCRGMLIINVSSQSFISFAADGRGRSPPCRAWLPQLATVTIVAEEWMQILRQECWPESGHRP